ncbi:MAG TPA: hypothetical protein VJV03_08765 [Pyrinomonadaceae bacterium]|nr:hypothetical protein [Pyrinomonadaceae bacterium]
MSIREIKKYDVAYYAGARNHDNYAYQAIIGLRDENHVLVGAAFFHHSRSTMPEGDTEKATGFISCHYLADDYPRVLDILRNESPVFVEFEVSTGNVANLRTSAEPVGEGELSQVVELASAEKAT